jgi:hypothetical protein
LRIWGQVQKDAEVRIIGRTRKAITQQNRQHIWLPHLDRGLFPFLICKTSRVRPGILGTQKPDTLVPSWHTPCPPSAKKWITRIKSSVRYRAVTQGLPTMVTETCSKVPKDHATRTPGYDSHAVAADWTLLVVAIKAKLACLAAWLTAPKIGRQRVDSTQNGGVLQVCTVIVRKP